MAARTRLAQLIARREGFGLPGAIPTVRHNPGDLKHSPHSSHDGIDSEAVGKIATDEEGWEDLERQLQLYAQRGLSMRQMVELYAPPRENDTREYLAFLTEALAVDPDAPVSVALQIPAGE